MNLENKSAIECIELILKRNKRRKWMSESLQAEILRLGGKLFKASNIERRARASVHAASIRVPRKAYVQYQWAA